MPTGWTRSARSASRDVSMWPDAWDRACIDPDDPTAANRALDDRRFALDHFGAKLFKVAANFQTRTGAGPGGGADQDNAGLRAGAAGRDWRGKRMIRAAIVGLGWWGQNLVNSVRASETIRFTTAHTRTEATAAGFCADAGLRWTGSLDAILDDKDIDAVVFATPHTQHPEQVIRAAGGRQARFRRKAFQPFHGRCRTRANRRRTGPGSCWRSGSTGGSIPRWACCAMP